MSIQQLSVFVTTDGKQFTDIASANAHQFSLDNAAHISKVANSFVNTAVAPNAKEVGLVGRTRVFNANVASQVVAFLMASGQLSADALESFEEIVPSEELAARLAAEEVRVAELAAKKASTVAVEAPVETEAEAVADAEADLFAE